jgi:mono/diheme cytochrome c family protein
MRHLIANIATYTIATMLLVGAALFGWMRAAQVTLSDEETIVAHYAPVAGHEFEWQELGASSYLRNCSNCHGRDGEGWDQYPPLARAAGLLTAEGGREHLVDLHLYGLTSRRWRAPMPPMGHIPDVELAAVINHVITSFGVSAGGASELTLYLPSDIAARRGLGLTPWEVEKLRPSGD